jgi:two-component system, sensor histidine kinase YesM
MKQNTKLKFLREKSYWFFWGSVMVFLLEIILASCTVFVFFQPGEGENIKIPICILLFLLMVVVAASGVVKFFLPLYHMQKVLNALLGENGNMFRKICQSKTNGQIQELTQEIMGQIVQSVNSDYHLEVLKRRTDVATLQGQINPHFLYNTLDCIRGEALLRGADDIADMTKALSKFFRYSISHEGDLVTVEEELQNVKNYFKIQQFRFNNRHSLVIEYDQNDQNILDCLLPKLTLQPIVENAILHGLEQKVEPGTIKISMIATAKCLLIRCSDNGVGMSVEQLEKLETSINQNNKLDDLMDEQKQHSGIAMTNVNRRIQLFFGDDYGITISSMEHVGTDVDIRVPFSTTYSVGNMEKSNAARNT